MMKLLSATPSPYARKVRIALQEKGLAFELVTEQPWARDASAPRYNPLGKVPTLILPDGETVYESAFILEWLDAMHPDPALVPTDARGRLDARRLEVLGDGVCDAVVLTLMEHMRPADRRSAPWLERQSAKIAGGVAELARRIAPDAPFALGDRFGLGDIAVGCTLGYLDLRLPGFDWRAAHPALVPLFERLSRRPSFVATVPTAQTFSDPVV